MLQWIVEKALGYKQRKERSSFSCAAESLPSQVRAIVCIYCWRAEFYILPLLYCICLLTLRTHCIFMIIQSFYIPASASIDLKEVNRLVREAFVCLRGSVVLECVWAMLANTVDVYSIWRVQVMMYGILYVYISQAKERLAGRASCNTNVTIWTR